MNTSDSLENLQSDSNKGSFSPSFTTATLKLGGGSKTSQRVGISAYSQKHNMIIVSTDARCIHFVDASTFLPADGREKLKLKSNAICMSFCAETDVYLFGCSERDVYAYNASSKNLTKLQELCGTITTITFLSPVYYVFSAMGLDGMIIRSLENKDDVEFIKEKYDAASLCYLQNQKILLSTLSNGDLVIYRSNELPRFSRICSVKALKTVGYFQSIQIATIKQKGYIITYGYDEVIQIWHIRKGRIRLVRAIIIGERIFGLAYLEKYKMIAVTSGKSPNSVKFFSLASGKLEYTLDLNMAKARHVFLMEDKNAIGVTNLNTETIQIICLGEEGGHRS